MAPVPAMKRQLTTSKYFQKKKFKPGENSALTKATGVSARVSRSYLSTHIAGTSQSMRQTLCWNAYNGLVLVVNTYTEPIVVRLNSCYDPDAAIGGTQPQGFAKWMAFYTKCYVLRARIFVTVINDTTTGVTPGGCLTQVGVTISTFISNFSTIFQAIQNGLQKNTAIGNSPDRASFTMSVDVGKFMNVPKVIDDPELYCTASSNPTQVIAAHVWAQSETNAGSSIFYTVKVEYDCVFTDPQPFT